MQKLAKRLGLLAATCFALIGTARAQLVTYETISAWTGSVITLSAGSTYAQTFNNVTQVYSMTYLFAAYNNTSSANTTFEAYFAEWNPETNSVGATVQSWGTITLPATNTWTSFTELDGEAIYTKELEIVLDQVTDPTKTYAMVLQANNNRATLGFTRTNSDAFAYGYAVNESNYDWGFSQLVVAPALTPIPEASTVAVAFAGLFVAGMAGFRLHQRRRAAGTTPAVPAAA